jgi:Protein kinase domain
MPLDTGVRLGPYEIVSPIGAEAGGEVYKASDTEQNRTVAIKLLPPVLSNNSELRQRFEGEVKVLSGLSHPHICTPHEIRREADTDFLVMEYVEGETLARRLERGALALDEALKIAIDTHWIIGSNETDIGQQCNLTWTFSGPTSGSCVRYYTELIVETLWRHLAGKCISDDR